MTRAPLTIMAVLAALLMGVWWLTDGRAEEHAPAPPAAPVAEIAERVEAIRGLRFDTLPEPVEVTPVAPHFGAVDALRTSSIVLYGVSARIYSRWLEVTVLPIQPNLLQSNLTSGRLISCSK